MDDQGLPLADQGRIRDQQIAPLVRHNWALRMRLAAMQATTLEGFRAKARIIQEFSNCAPGYAELDDDDAMGWSLANDLLGVASVWRADDDGEAEPAAPLPAPVQPVPIVNPDAELIRLCDRLVANRAEEKAICDADEWAPDRGPYKARYDALGEEMDRVTDQLYATADPVTAAGVRAAARAALCVAPKDSDGDITCDGLAEWLAFAVVQHVGGEAAA